MAKNFRVDRDKKKLQFQWSLDRAKKFPDEDTPGVNEGGVILRRSRTHLRCVCVCDDDDDDDTLKIYFSTRRGN